MSQTSVEVSCLFPCLVRSHVSHVTLFKVDLENKGPVCKQWLAICSTSKCVHLSPDSLMVLSCL